MALVPVPDGDTEGECAMSATTPASPSLQGIPPELRNKIYNYLALTEPRDVSARQLLKLRRQSQDGDLWKQFQSATARHHLTASCRQMCTEFGSVLVLTTGQTYHFNVSNLDPHQLALFRDLVTTYCFSHMISDKNLPPFIIPKVVLCLNLDSDILPSIETHGQAVHSHSRSGCRAIKFGSTSVTLMVKVSSSDYDNSSSKSKFVTKIQAKLAIDALRGIDNTYQTCELHEPDRRAMELALDHLTDMLNNHNRYWPTTSDETKDT